MELYFGTDNKFHVLITSLDYRNNHTEHYVLDTYQEACKKFSTIFRWNHGVRPMLPSYETFMGIPEGFIAPINKVTEEAV